MVAAEVRGMLAVCVANAAPSAAAASRHCKLEGAGQREDLFGQVCAPSGCYPIVVVMLRPGGGVSRTEHA